MLQPIRESRTALLEPLVGLRLVAGGNSSALRSLALQCNRARVHFASFIADCLPTLGTRFLPSQPSNQQKHSSNKKFQAEFSARSSEQVHRAPAIISKLSAFGEFMRHNSLGSVFASMPAPVHQLTEGFLKSWGMILASEIGDKTFFIAAVMAMKHPRMTVFAGALSALAVMTVLSAAMGWAAPNLISKRYTRYAAIALFFFFGARSMYDVYKSTGEDSDELEEVEKEIQEKEAKQNKDEAKRINMLAKAVFSPIFVEAFVLTFLAEWGDRSQIATIGLAASVDIIGVTLGGILGHGICTGAAVLGGRQLATHIQERTVLLVGGLLFIAFGVHAAVTIDEP